MPVAVRRRGIEEGREIRKASRRFEGKVERREKSKNFFCRKLVTVERRVGQLLRNTMAQR